MNRTIAKVGAALVTVTVFLFAVCLIVDFVFGAYFVCMLLPIGYIMMAAGLCRESDDAHRVAASVGMTLAAVYATLILIVYFAQATSVRLDGLGEEALHVLDYSRFGLLFNYDLLGYGMMALSTFFVALTIVPRGKEDVWLKRLMLIHGAFFFSCFIMPMTGMFAAMSHGGTSHGGVIALVAWCAYFLPIGVLAYRHFTRAD